MKNKKLIIGIAAGAAVLAGAALIIAKRRSHKCHDLDIEEVKKDFRNKLKELQSKAEKEARNAASDTKEAFNTVKDRANEWVNNRVNS